MLKKIILFIILLVFFSSISPQKDRVNRTVSFNYSISISSLFKTDSDRAELMNVCAEF